MAWDVPIRSDRLSASLALLAPTAAGALAWSLTADAPVALRIACAATVLAALYLLRLGHRPWHLYAVATVAAMAGLLALRAPDLGWRDQLALWLSFVTVAAVIGFLLTRLQSQEAMLERANQTDGPLRRAFTENGRGLADWRLGASLGDYVIAVMAPVAGGLLVWYLMADTADWLRGTAVLAVLAVLVYGIVNRPIWVAYAAGTVAVLMPLLAAGGLPTQALAAQGVTFVAVVGVVVYLTARLRVQARSLAVVDDRRARYVALTNHELRTPVAVLSSMLETLKEDLEDALTPEQAAFLRAACSSTDNLASRIDLLSKLQELTEQPDRRDGRQEALRVIVDGVIERCRGAARDRGLSVAVEMSPNASQRLVPLSDTRTVLEQVVGNAVKFSPEGGRVTVRAWVADDELVCEVADEGPGVAAQERGAIFDSFYQPGDLMRRSVEGMGVGLAVARLSARRIGGTLAVRNRVAGGACFTLRLPADQRRLLPFPAPIKDRVPA